MNMKINFKQNGIWKCNRFLFFCANLKSRVSLQLLTRYIEIFPIGGLAGISGTSTKRYCGSSLVASWFLSENQGSSGFTAFFSGAGAGLGAATVFRVLPLS